VDLQNVVDSLSSVNSPVACKARNVDEELKWTWRHIQTATFAWPTNVVSMEMGYTVCLNLAPLQSLTVNAYLWDVIVKLNSFHVFQTLNQRRQLNSYKDTVLWRCLGNIVVCVVTTRLKTHVFRFIAFIAILHSVRCSCKALKWERRMSSIWEFVPGIFRMVIPARQQALH